MGTVKFFRFLLDDLGSSEGFADGRYSSSGGT